MLIDIILYILTTIIVLIIGNFTVRLLFNNNSQFHSLEFTFIFGFFTISLISQLFVFRNIALLVLINIVVFYLLTNWKKLTKINYLKIIKENRTIIFIISFFLVLISSISADLVRDYDSYLYHLQSIRWLIENPLVIGISNLHQRLAFQSIWFNWHSLFALESIFGYPIAFLNGWITFVLFSYLTLQAKKPNLKIPIIVFSISFFSFALHYPLYMILRGYNPDVPVMVFTIFFFYILFKEKRSFYQNTLLLITSLLLFWMKLSALPLVLFSLIEIILTIKEKKVTKKQVIFLLITSLLVGTIYICINIMKSGYLIYPISSTRINLLWAEDSNSVKWLQTVISSWAKVGKSNVEYSTPLNLSWIKIWLSNISNTDLYLFILTVINVIVIQIFSKKQNIKIYLILLFLYWFLIAPDFRFGLGVILSSLFLSIIYINKKVNKKLKYVILMIILFSGVITHGNLFNYIHWMRMVPQIKPWGLMNQENQSITVNEHEYFIPIDKSNDQSSYNYFPSTPQVNACLKVKKNFVDVYYIDCN